MSAARFALLLIASFAVVACGDDDGTAGAPDGGSSTDAGSMDTGTEDAGSDDAGSGDAGVEAPDPLYLVYTNVFAPDFTATALVHVVDSLDEATVFDGSQALEVDNDYVDLSVPTDNPDRAFYASFRSRPVIQRWVVDEDGDFAMDGEMGLSGLGVTNAASLQDGLTFVSPTKAFFLDFTGLQAVIFNPTEMTITDTISLEGLAEGLPEGVPVHAYYRQIDGDRIVVATNHSTDEGWISVSKLMVLDMTDNSVTYDERTDCGALSWTARDSEGNMYFVSHSSHAGPSEVGIGDDFPSCMLRVRTGASEFDPDYYVNLRELMGAPAGALMEGVGGLAYTFGYTGDPSVLTPENIDMLFGPVWAYYSFELGNEAASLAPVPGRMPGAAFAVSGTVDVEGLGESSYVTSISMDFSTTTVFNTSDPENWEEMTTVPGFVYDIFRLQ